MAANQAVRHLCRAADQRKVAHVPRQPDRGQPPLPAPLRPRADRIAGERRCLRARDARRRARRRGAQGQPRRWARAALPCFRQGLGQRLARGWQPFGHQRARGRRAARLGVITPPARQALLLTTLEDFTIPEAAAILEKTPEEVAALVAEAIAEIDREQTTSVLIIEDEPLIAMQLEDLVTGLGHTVSGTAATRTQARAAVAEAMPGLVLADIQLADGSSGLDAVDDILSVGSMPVIFITAYPERLLTGDRPEPTYLVTKPFQEATVRAAISQALFFGSTRPL